jgi:hypothetical protein
VGIRKKAASTSIKADNTGSAKEERGKLFAGQPGAIISKEGAERRRSLRDGKQVSTVYDPRAPVFFMIGSQRSGSNWLRTMLNEREDLVSPLAPSP